MDIVEPKIKTKIMAGVSFIVAKKRQMTLCQLCPDRQRAGWQYFATEQRLVFLAGPEVQTESAKKDQKEQQPPTMEDVKKAIKSAIGRDI